MAKQIIAVNIFVHSYRTSILRTICLSLSPGPFLLLSPSLPLSACTFQRIRRTELKAMKRSHFLLILSVPLSASLFFTQSINVDIFVFIPPLGYKSRCLPIQSSFLFSNSLHPGQDRTLPLILFPFNDIIIYLFFFWLHQCYNAYLSMKLRFSDGQNKLKHYLNSQSGKTWFDLIWLDSTRLALTWLDSPWLESTPLDMNWVDYTWLDLTWLDMTWLDLISFDSTWLDLTWLDLIWFNFTRLDLTWLHLIYIDSIWLDLTSHDLTRRHFTWLEESSS